VTPGPIAASEVAARLVALLPGLREFADERAARGRARMAELWARVRPNSPRPAYTGPPDAHLLDPDTLLEHAGALGWHIDSRNLAGLADDAYIPTILGDLPALGEPVLVVTHGLACHRVAASELAEFISDEPDVHRHGDALFVCTITARIVILHHEDWRFDVTSPRGT
jgi:hypothetical protein